MTSSRGLKLDSAADQGTLRFFSKSMVRGISIFISVLLLIFPPVCGQQSGLRQGSFKMYENQTTWSDAQSFCREKHTDLVTIRNNEENSALHSLGGWIGVYRNNLADPWKWSRGDTKATFFNWDHDEPDDHQHCGSKPMSGDKWKNNECDQKKGFICYDEGLVLVKENKTWEEAYEHCKSLKVNSYNLATLITPDDHNYAREHAQQATTDEVWTGLHHLGDEWFWVGGEPVTYQGFPSCPAFRCGGLQKNSATSFGIIDCSQRRNFFCYKKPETTQT